MSRVYLDHNATTPLRAEARDAMIAAMDVMGNPSSVHAEGRAAKAVVERARAQVAALVRCEPTQVIFTGSATEAAALAIAQKAKHGGRFAAFGTEHDCFHVWSEADICAPYGADGAMTGNGAKGVFAMMDWVLQPVEKQWSPDRSDQALVAMSAANSETGLMFKSVPTDEKINALISGTVPFAVVTDITQLAGKAAIEYNGDKRPSYAVLSAHKLGGPKGVGALINFTVDDPTAMLRGGGQEMGRRSGTENVIGIAGFGAAAEAAQRDVDAGKWAAVEKLRNILETALAAASNATIFVGKEALRLPNTTCFATPGWKGETQVMQMDLAGFAISAGSACSSGKVKASRVLEAMGLGDIAANAVRVSLGLETTEEDVMRFADTWAQKLKKHQARAA
ncbi:aminotransferase class V-fold PLP-dependent enzyme [uncultured Tateyamaria sp.]|uniref:cysteine desulfurase family protein n=1 Tax=Tateyamaria sp. TaxID=1929288 RepID=UPI0026204708|nr:aminotransferase class V-fold PLP-dependent enzyme [uncultured Tateyamaria sp.]